MRYAPAQGVAFTMWPAGGGVKPGTVLGKTDDFCYGVRY